MLLLFAACIQDAAAQSWYNAGWPFRKKITIDNARVGSTGAPHTNFVVLINLTSDANLTASARSDGYDILFTSSDGTTKLNHEIESYTSSTGALTAWVQIPSLPSSVSTVLYMYYGNAAAANQQNVTGTWDATFKAVWHLNGVFTDATANNYDGTNYGTASATGKIAGGRSCYRANGADYIYIPGKMGTPASITLSAWAYLNSADASGAEVISIGDYVALRMDAPSGGTEGFAYNSGGTWGNTTTNANHAGSWRYIVYTFSDAGNSQRLYIGGTQAASSSYTASIYYSGLGSNTYIGTHGNGNSGMDFDGTLDEVRVSSSARSAGWVLTEYNNQNSPSTFYTLGGQQSVKTWDGGAGTSNWGDANNWNPDGVPGSLDNVNLTGANTINVNVAGTCGNLTLDNTGLTLTIQPAGSLAVSGNLVMNAGTLNTQAAFPAVAGSVTLSGGAVGYTLSGAQTVSGPDILRPRPLGLGR